MRGFVLGGGGLAHGGRSQPALLGEEFFGLGAVGAAVLLFDRVEALDVAVGRLQRACGAIERNGPLAAGRDGAEELGIRRDFARDLILGVLDLGRGRGDRGAFGIDGGACLARQIVEAEERHHGHDGYDHDGGKLQSRCGSFDLCPAAVRR